MSVNNTSGAEPKSASEYPALRRKSQFKLLNREELRGRGMDIRHVLEDATDEDDHRVIAAGSFS